MRAEWTFTFHGDVRAAAQFLRLHGAGTGIYLDHPGGGRLDMAEMLAAGAYAADVWSQLRLWGETQWDRPEALWEALTAHDVGPQQRFQWLGAAALRQLPPAAREVYERQPPVSLSMAVDTHWPLAEVQRLWREHPLYAEGEGWMALRTWGRGHGVVAEANPFAPRADAEVYFVQVRDLARRVPLRVDQWGFRSVRAWLPLVACRSLMRQFGS